MGQVQGQLLRDVRLNAEGKESDGGRLRLRGEFVSVDESLRNIVDTKARQKARVFMDKQVVPDKALQKENETLRRRIAELEANQKKV